MQAVIEFDAEFQRVLVYPDRIVMLPGIFKKLGGAVEKTIRFADLSDVHLREGTLIFNGYIHFAFLNEQDPRPPAIALASGDRNTFMFGRGKNQEAAKLWEYALARVSEASAARTVTETTGRSVDGDLEPGRGGALELAPSTLKIASPLELGDYERFRRLTGDRNWFGIMECNGLSKELTGVGKELRVLGQYIQEGEVVFALVAGLMSQTATSNPIEAGFNTWLGVLTDRRVLMLDHAMLTSSVDTQSIRHDRIQAVSASQGWVFGKVVIDIGNRSIEIDNCDKEHVKIFAKHANDWLEHLANKASNASKASAVAQARDPIAEIKRLAELREAGILSDEEFAKAKEALLSRL